MESTISTGKGAKLLGVTVKTLQRWDREGRLTPIARTDSNRHFTPRHKFASLSACGKRIHTPTKRVAYCRVSSATQKPDLANQRQALEEFVVAKGIGRG